MKSNYELMAAYNQWMNKAMYESASTLSNDEIQKDRGAFFGSIIGSLNHILVGDTIWLKRFAGHEIEYPSLGYVRDLESPGALNAILCSSLSVLAEERSKMDEVIVLFSSELTEQAIASPLAYTNTKGQPFIKNFGYSLQHFFNHQTHHRGQVSTLLYQAGVDVGVTDLLVGIPNE